MNQSYDVVKARFKGKWMFLCRTYLNDYLIIIQKPAKHLFLLFSDWGDRRQQEHSRQMHQETSGPLVVGGSRDSRARASFSSLGSAGLATDLLLFF